MRLSATDVYLLSGQGQLHFLFRDGQQVVWLSADPPVACLALADALGARAEELGCRADGTMAAPLH